MSETFGQVDAALTRAVNRIGAGESSSVFFTRHAEAAMDDDGFDHGHVLECLRKGKAHAPEPTPKGLTSNVVHRGLHIRVVVGGLDQANGDWRRLESLRVVSVMKVA